MEKPKMPDKKHNFNPDVEAKITDLIYREYDTSKSNQNIDNADFEAVIDLLECKRNEKNYSWNSDVFYPEFAAELNTEMSEAANQYFPSRDFVDVYLESDDPDGLEKCKTAKKLINKTLNARYLHYYLKYMRAKVMNSTARSVVAVAWWEKQLAQVQTGVNRIPFALDVDNYGNKVTDPNVQTPALGYREEPVIGKDIIQDRFNFDVCDPRNVFYDNKYTYSLQEKNWITIRVETNYEELKEQAQMCGYINLDLVKEKVEGHKTLPETDTSSETYNKEAKDQKVEKPPVKDFDKLIRFGKIWAIITEDFKGIPVKIEPGVDELGNVKEKAVLIEAITEVALFDSGQHRVLIRFQPNCFLDAHDKPYKPIFRGLNYIHPTKDVGMSDGMYARELQVALNDNINMSNDRTKLATLPTMLVQEYDNEDNDQIFIEPEHKIPVKDVDKSIKWLEISDNIRGSMDMTQLYISGMQKVNAKFPSSMGEVPGQASTTATAIAGSETRTNMRANYKSLTFEYTFLCELYWMILNMTKQLAEPETIIHMLGEELAQYLDGDCDYQYQPVSSNIETEYNKLKKISTLDQSIGRLAGLVQILPEVVPVIAYMAQMQLELQGQEFSKISAMIDKLAKAKPIQEAPGAPVSQPQSMSIPTSNQSGIPMSGMEVSARDMRNEAGMSA
jgi:hypothetical protein